jgi:hypothetical protein
MGFALVCAFVLVKVTLNKANKAESLKVAFFMRFFCLG